MIVDLGMGNGQFLIDLAKEFRTLNEKESKIGNSKPINGCTLIGVSASSSEIKQHACKYAGIQLIHGHLPFDAPLREFLQIYANKVDMVFDTFGPATYSSNPLHSLIFSSLLLKEGGKFSAITSTEGDEQWSVFGNEEDREKIKAFFAEYLGINIKFEFTVIESLVDKGSFKTDLLVNFTKGEIRLGAEVYLRLCRIVNEEVGMSQAAKRPWRLFGEFKIQMRTQKTFDEPISPEEVDAFKIK